MSRENLAVVGLSIMLVSGCLGDVSPPNGSERFLVRDSAGIVIVENADSAWTAATSWAVEDTPSFMLGTRDGDPPGTDFSVITGARKLSDGRLVVADGLSNQIRLFDRSGRLVTLIGGTGQAPQEWLRLDRIAVIDGDSIFARDVGAFKTIVFTSDGSFVRTVNGPPMLWNNLTAVYVAGWLRNGAAVVSHVNQPGALPSDRAMIVQEWHLFDPDGNHARQLADLPAYERNVTGSGAGTPVFAPRGIVAVGAGELWYGYPSSFELRRINSLGEVDRIVRRNWVHQPVPRPAMEEYRRWLELQVDPSLPPALQEVQRSRAEQASFADVFPAFQNVIVSTDGTLWVQAYLSADDFTVPARDWGPRRASRIYSIFTSQGEWLGSVTMPDLDRVLEIGRDYVLGVHSDELGVEYLAEHRIIKPN